MIAKKLDEWDSSSPDWMSYRFKTKSAAKRFMRNLGFRGREIFAPGTDAESHGYTDGKLLFGRFFPASDVEGCKYIAHILRK